MTGNAKPGTALRILAAVRMSAGLGIKQIERMEKARTAIAKARGQ